MIFELLYALFMGLLQGLTEWLPISSSGHLVLAQHFYAISERTLFDAILHLGTFFAALVYFRKDIKPLLNIKNSLTHKIILASIPIIIIGVLISEIIEVAFAFAIIAAILLIINGFVLLTNAFFEFPGRKKKSKKESKITFKQALIIGIFQIFALFPGISRSGTTITTGRALGLDWKRAAKFSFFISFIPIAGAAGFKIATDWHEFEPFYIIGFIAAFIVGYATIDIMMRILQLGKFHYFGFYSIMIGVGMLILMTII